MQQMHVVLPNERVQGREQQDDGHRPSGGTAGRVSCANFIVLPYVAPEAGRVTHVERHIEANGLSGGFRKLGWAITEGAAGPTESILQVDRPRLRRGRVFFFRLIGRDMPLISGPQFERQSCEVGNR